MRFLTLFMFAAVLISVVIAEDKVEKKKVWWHAPMFKKTWNQAKICYKEGRLDCWADLKDQFGKGVNVFVDRYLAKHEEPPQ